MKLCRLRGLVGLITLALMSSVLPVFAQRGQEVTLNEGTKLTLRLNDHISTKTARSGDRFSAEVVTPIYKGNTVVIPAGTIVNGRLGNVKRPGRIKGRAEMDLRFESIRLPNGFEEPIVARLSNLDRREKEQVDREGTVKGQGSKGRDTAVIATGGGVGAGIGAIAGGAKGTAIGGGAGAIIGLGTVLATRGKDAELQRGTELDIVLDRPLRIAVD